MHFYNFLCDNQKSKGVDTMISFQPLRDILDKRKITTYYLRNKCGIYNLDSKTIQRLMNDESVSTNTLNSLCHILQCDLEDIISFIPDQDEN